jgi:uncharacterized protein (DUF362 family)
MLPRWTLLKVCPRTGRVVGFRAGSRWWMPIVGLAALVWFVARTWRRPDRAQYPCLQVAGPLAAGFVGYVATLAAAVFGARRARRYLAQYRYAPAAAFVALALGGLFLNLDLSSRDSAAESNGAFHPIDAPNAPMGTAKGILPGRVAWAHDPAATSWNGSSNYWWSAAYNDQAVINALLEKVVTSVSGGTGVTEAWDRLFRDLNNRKGLGDVGYSAGQKIAVKINLNSGGSSNNTDASPQLVFALLDQLVHRAGVAQADITLYDAARTNITAVRSICQPAFPNVRYNSWGSLSTRIAFSNAVVSDSGSRQIPAAVVDASYLINMALLKRHSRPSASWTGSDGQTGVTLCAKNLFGSTGSPAGMHESIRDWKASRGMGSYNALVDLQGSRYLGGNTVLYILDGLWSTNIHNGTPKRWTIAPFGNDWPSSVFASQDPMAIDSVGLDLLNAQFGLIANADNYLHEGALAGDPPSGTSYRPDGTRLSSLGVHEHWNNAMQKSYTRNLGTGNGIELVYMGPGGMPTPTPTPTATRTPTPTATPSAPGAFIEITPDAAAVSASTQDANVPGNTVDGLLSTRWSGAGDGAWIQYDLGTVRTVAFVEVAVYNGTSRQNIFDLQASTGTGWTAVFSGRSSGTTTQEEIYDFTDVAARYVRYLGHVSTANNFNSVTEVRIFAPSGGTPTWTPTPTPTLVTPAPTPTLSPTPPSSYTEITPPATAVTASTNDGNIPANAVDGSLSTRWSGAGDGAWLQLDLGTPRLVAYLTIGVFNGDTRRNRFDIVASMEGQSWSPVLTGAQTNLSTGEERFDLGVTARWIRYVGHGNTDPAKATWNSLTEISVFAPSMVP